jgi:hypothetical protein
VPRTVSVRIAAVSLACLAGIALYLWTTHVRRPPTPPPARLPSSARKMLQPSRSDTLDLTVDPERELSYEVGMQAGATLVYAWSASPRNAGLSCEFAGRRTDGVFDAHSALVAQSAGWYRWHWKNPGRRPVTIHLKLSGYYEPGAVPISPSSLQ